MKETFVKRHALALVLAMVAGLLLVVSTICWLTIQSQTKIFGFQVNDLVILFVVALIIVIIIGLSSVVLDNIKRSGRLHR